LVGSSLAGVVDGALRPIADAPALSLAPARPGGCPTVIVADLHLGLGGTAARPGGPPEGSAELLQRRLLDLLEAERADRLVVAGDIKHPIVGVPPPLRPVLFEFFAGILREGYAAEVVLGNHDVGLARHLPSEVAVRPSSGIVRYGVGIFHGHRWPANAVLRAPRLVVGHLHPGFRLAPTPDHPLGKRPCWVRVTLPPRGAAPRRRPRRPEVRAREIVVLPAFHPLAGIEALNRQRPARGRSFLFGRFLSRGVARAYLLDGTDLGPIPTGPGVGRPKRASGRATPDR
jgi:uncharacterized protein